MADKEIKLTIVVGAQSHIAHRCVNLTLVPVAMFGPIIASRYLIGPSLLVDTLALLWLFTCIFAVAHTASEKYKNTRESFTNTDDAAAWVKDWKGPDHG